ncbi:MAG: stalk domain-containing protein [Fimbriimonas sp.]|nr:stalk domain-containing protein [Fimbriimonas sp.]
MGVLAGIAALAVSANAIALDARIMIDRALNSPTLTVRYNGAHAALVELQVNGVSLGTRSVTASAESGETNFTINLSELKDGDNEVVVRLFDRTGKLVGSDRTNISTDQSNQGPVYLTAPKMGATVNGPVEINLGFGRELKNSYVSFFVDSNFKKMSNYPPYTFVWDTTRESNGWHVVEAWAIDESSTTYKTKQTRVFVNNPHGDTPRNGVSTDVTPTNPTLKPNTVENEAGTRDIALGGKTSASSAIGTTAPHVSSNPIHSAITGAVSGVKPAPVEKSIATGPRSLVPNHTRVATNFQPDKGVISITSSVITPTKAQQLPNANVLNSFNSAARMVSITRGQRVPNLGAFAIELNNQFVKFDVKPRVDNGVPMTPFRYLIEKDGGKVDWANMTKTVTASADGKSIMIQIGDKNAQVDKMTVSMEVTPYIDHGRTIVPLSFIHDALNVDVQYDKETGHVLITTIKK